MSAAVAIVTGASAGIGEAVARWALGCGWDVVGVSRKWPARPPGGAYEHWCADVADEAAVVEMVRATRERHGPIYALVNCAGVASMNLALSMPAGAARRIMETNFLGTFLCCREAAKAMVPERCGRIVNVVSVADPLHLPGEAVYAASKAAVASFTRVLAHEVGGLGVTVNAVGPGPVRTGMTRGVPEAALEALVARQAIRRFCTPEDVVNVVDFFLRPESAMVTGQVVYLGGAP